MLYSSCGYGEIYIGSESRMNFVENGCTSLWGIYVIFFHDFRIIVKIRI